MELFLIVILGVLLYPVFKVWRVVRRVRRDMRKAYNAQGRNTYKGSSNRRDGQFHEYDPTTGREKKYTSDEGEYVEFEECTDSPAEPRHTQSHVQYQQEEQISDAEFEEIP